MNLTDFKATLVNDSPPAGLAAPLLALWLDAKADWKGAHDALQNQPDGNGSAWVHAYLHRVEGDPTNARYWYRRANKPESQAALAEEWDGIAAALLAGQL
ncbi:MAG: hypothetical protein KJZ86_24870 [Caldilineaceae bacterium]|nr:hypothetical protein [Caldilineaceae bacterium]HRJ43106.1 hypothetical protein [Caldilineaceae bacterium]